MSSQENITKLSELREQALAAIKQYNEIAETENYETRIGIIDASYDLDDMKYELALEALEGSKEEPSQELIDSMEVDISTLQRNENPYWSTNFPGTKGYSWQPSGLNC